MVLNQLMDQYQDGEWLHLHPVLIKQDIMANSSEDAALVLQNIIGKDNLDGTSIHHPQSNLIQNINADIKGKKIGLITEFLNEIKNSKTYEVIMSALREFENLGAIIDEVSLPHCSYGIPFTTFLLQLNVHQTLVDMMA